MHEDKRKSVYTKDGLAIICPEEDIKDHLGYCIYWQRCTTYNPNKELCRDHRRRDKRKDNKHPIQNDDAVSKRLEKYGVLEELKSYYDRIEE